MKYFAAEPEVSSSDPKGGLHAHNKKHSKAETDPRLGVKKADASKHKKTGTFLVFVKTGLLTFFSYLSKFAADICSNVVAVLVSLYLLYRLLTIFVIELFCSI